MKIVYLLASSMISGGGKVILQQADELARRGHAVTVIGPEDAPGWYSLRHARYERSLFASSERLRDADVAVATFWTTIEPAAATASGALFHLCQGLETESAFYAAQSEAIEGAYRLIPRKVVVSPHLRDSLNRLGYSDVQDVGQAFEPGEFLGAARADPRGPLKILLPGIFEIDLKGVREALEALRGLRDQGWPFRLVRVSPEPMSDGEGQWRVVDDYHRALPPRRMPALLADADIFLGPNHENEGFGLPTLEALAAGLPAALSDTPSHRSIAGASAIFFPPRDVAGIRLAILRLLGEEETRRRLSAEGPVRAGRFRTADVGDRLEEAFRRAVDV